MKLPPPATELSAPPSAAAKKRRTRVRGLSVFAEEVEAS
jgi:hypothetical protein